MSLLSSHLPQDSPFREAVEFTPSGVFATYLLIRLWDKMLVKGGGPYPEMLLVL